MYSGADRNYFFNWIRHCHSTKITEKLIARSGQMLMKAKRSRAANDIFAVFFAVAALAVCLLCESV